MKNSARERWVTSWKAGAGYGDNKSDYGHGDNGLYQFEGFGLRLKSSFQTMLTYKTNNTGTDVGRETTNLYHTDFSDILQPHHYIILASPTVSGINLERGLMNRSHAVTANSMKRINENSQINFQLTYNHDHQRAWGERNTEYLRTSNHLVINNIKAWEGIDNELFGLVKYEHNSPQKYLRNTLSADLSWTRQTLHETSNVQRYQQANTPIYDLNDNLYLILRKGHTLVSVYSYNTLKNMPHSLVVDSTKSQTIKQRFFSTDTYAMAGWKFSTFNLSMRLGLKGTLRNIEAVAVGIPDSLGVLSDKSRFGYVTLYASPEIEHIGRKLKISLAAPFECAYYKYSVDVGKNRFDVSPTANIRWDVTPRIAMSVNGQYNIAPIDISRFYGAVMMQDYLYLNKGQVGYDVSTSKTLRYTFLYRNALQGTHLTASVSRTLATNPYTLTRSFKGDYIILGTTAVKSSDKSWNGNLIYQQALPWLGGKLSIRSMYSHTDSRMLQDNSMISSAYNALNIHASLLLSLYKDMSATISTKYNYNDIDSQVGEKTSFRSWMQQMVLTLPLSTLHIKAGGEYYHNQISKGNYKNMVFLDFALALNQKHFEWELKASNLLNKKMYAYSNVSNLITTQAITAIRGRELMLSIVYKP